MAHAHLQDLWWPPFEDLYTALQEYKALRSSSVDEHLQKLLAKSTKWLRLGLQGFEPPAAEALTLVQQGGRLKLRHGSVLPIKAELQAATLSFSQLMGLNEIQAYVLVYRWSMKHANIVPEVSQELLQQLQETYFLQRSCLLRSIQHLLLELDMSDKPHQSLTASAITEALEGGLDANLCEFLATSLDPECHCSLALKGSSPAAAPDDSAAASTKDRGHSYFCQQQALIEQEFVMEIIISLFEQTVCSVTCFSKVMNAIHLHIFSLWHEAIAAGGTKTRVAGLAQLLSLQLLYLPVLLEHLRLGTPPDPQEAPLLSSSQDTLCQLFTSWVCSTDSKALSPASLTSGHAPALLAFAAIATLSRDIPSFSGPLANIDAAFFARKAMDLAAVASLRELAVNKLNDGIGSPRILLNLVCVAMAAFDLSPFTLPLPELQAFVDTLAHLYKGQEELCTAFHDARDPDHFLHAPVRHFYQQALELFFEAPTILLKLWHSLACGHDNAENVANMLENPVSPTMRLVDPAAFAWLDGSNATALQATKDLHVPQADGLIVLKGTVGKVLPKPLHLLQQEQHGVSGDTAMLSSSSTILVLWLPHADPTTAGSQKQVGAQDGDKEDIQMQPANNRVLALGWARLQEFKQAGAKGGQAQKASADLLLILKLFTRLAESTATIGQDVLRVKHMMRHVENAEEGADALDLACQTADALCRLQNPSVELLGACVNLMAALAIAYPGYVCATVMGTHLFASRASGHPHLPKLQQSHLSSYSLPMLAYAQRTWESAHGQYPVTLAVLGLTYELIISGLSAESVKLLVGFTLNNVLASCNSWRFTTRSQKWLIKAAALRVLHACLANPLAAQAPAGDGKQYEPDWSLARAVAEAVSRPGEPAGYLFVNLPPPEDASSTLAKRLNREVETDAIESLTIQWLQLLPLLIEACAQLPHPSAFLYDVFQASGDKSSAAAILTSYMAYAFVDYHTASVALLQACQALAVAAGRIPHGQALFASCFLHDSSGRVSTSFEKALARHFQPSQAKSNPAAFAAAAELLITILTDRHPQLLQVLQGGAIQQEADKENFSQSANGVSKDSTQAAKASSKEAPSCLDGLWEILQQSNKFLDEHAEVLAHALHVVSIMWQAGGLAALPVTSLRSQPDFLKCLTSCISASPPDTLQNAGAPGTLAGSWANRAFNAWQLLAEAHALTIITTEAFLYPREAGTPAGVWAILDEWTKDGGLSSTKLQHYTKPCWLQGDVHQADQLFEELYLEAEIRLMAAYACMTHLRGVDLSKHIAGHTLLASMWQTVSPVLQAFVGDSSQREKAREGALRELRDVLVTREGSSSAWKSLTADACAARHRDSTDEDQQMSHDARLVLLLHDLRQLRLVDTCLQTALLRHPTTFPRQYGECFLYDDLLFTAAIGDLLTERVNTDDLQQKFQACSVLASVQDAQVQAAQALNGLVAVANRSSTGARALAVSTHAVTSTLVCFKESLKAVTVRAEAEHTAAHAPGVQARQADHAISQQAAQILASQVSLWRAKQPASQQLPSAGAPGTAAKPPKASAPSRLAISSSAAQGCSPEEHLADLALCQEVLDTVRYWLQHQRRSCPESLASCSPNPITACLLSGLASVLHSIGTVLGTANASPSTPKPARQGLRCGAQTLLPELCCLVEAQGCFASAAASVTTLVLTAGMLTPPDWAPVLSRHLQLVTCMAKAVQTTALARQQHQLAMSQQRKAHQAAVGNEQSGHGSVGESAGGGLEGASEEALLALALHLAQTPPGAQMLLEQGVTSFIPALAKWLLSPENGGNHLLDQLAGSWAASTGEQTAPETMADLHQEGNHGKSGDLAGMYDSRGRPSAPYLQWLALLSLTGALVQSVEQDDRLDSAVVSFLVIAQERIMLILTPPPADSPQPLTLALLQEVERVLFLVSAVSRLKGQLQMATQGALGASGLLQAGGPFAIRQASCAFLDFAASAVDQQQQPCCLPITAQEKSMASSNSHIPLSQAWFKMTALGSVPHQQSQLQHSPFGSGGKAGVAATDFSCQMAEAMYSCVMLALKLLAAFCPEVGPQQEHQQGWPRSHVLISLQKQCQILAQASFQPPSKRAVSLCQNLYGILMLSQQLLCRLPVNVGDREDKDFQMAIQKLQSVLNRT